MGGGLGLGLDGTALSGPHGIDLRRAPEPAPFARVLRTECATGWQRSTEFGPTAEHGQHR